MPYYSNSCCPCIDRESPFYKDPKTGEWKKIDAVKHVDIHIDETQNEDYRCPIHGITVHVDGLDNYDQVKDLIGYIYGLWEKK